MTKAISPRKALLLAVILFLLSTTPSNGYEREKFIAKLPLVRKLPMVLPTIASYPIKAFKVSEPILGAEAAIAVDVDSGVLLYEKNADQKAYPASTTKLITALVAMDLYKPEEVVRVRVSDIEGNQSGVLFGENLTFLNLLYAALVPSGNDAAYTLALEKSTLEQFIDAMNKKAEMLSMSDTHFTNPAGLPDPNHFSTVRDLAELGKVALQEPLLRKIVSTQEIIISNIEKTQWHTLKTTNELLGINGVNGIKTGWTDEGLGALIASTNRNGRNVITVVLKSEDRFTDTQNLLDYVFSAYRW